VKTRTLALGALLGSSALLLSACSGAGDASDGASADAVQVVASTNVYGDLAHTVGGDLVDVTSIIDSPDKDPHEYEATARDQLALSDAALVIENGGGYDPFVDKMLDSASSKAPVITATVVAGLEDEHAHDDERSSDEHDDADGHDHAEYNEHVWYDLAVVRDVVGRIADELSTIDPDNASTYSANAESLTGDLDTLVEREQELKGTVGGRSIAITEPVPLYLTDALGLVDETPEAFSEAVEEGTDVPATTLQETLALFSGGGVDALVYNEQAESAQTDAVLDAAKAAGVPQVGVTETLPDGDDYVSWMTANLDALEEALSS
jgi:zinc/manganese transport system substrate-binding protein